MSSEPNETLICLCCGFYAPDTQKDVAWLRVRANTYICDACCCEIAEIYSLKMWDHTERRRSMVFEYGPYVRVV